MDSGIEALLYIGAFFGVCAVAGPGIIVSTFCLIDYNHRKELVEKMMPYYNSGRLEEKPTINKVYNPELYRKFLLSEINKKS